jgi:gliding motility-associated lipoprotein GldH
MCGKNERRIGKSQRAGAKRFINIFNNSVVTDFIMMDFIKKFTANLFLLLFCCTFLFCCQSIDTFEINKTIPGHSWKSDFEVKGFFTVKDTVSKYDMYVLLRHTDAYRYNNIWLNIGLQYPGEKIEYKKINLSLGNDRNGWEGSGINDIWYVKKKLNKLPFALEHAGNYHFSISNIMRDDPLEHVMSVGLSVEKSTQSN